MTTHDQIIIICVLAFIAVPLGTFITIKTINKLSRPPVNTLVRSGDIELVDYIDPAQPSYNYPDLLESTYGRITSLAPTYQTGVLPSYRSGTLPYYQSVDGFINCPLELHLWDLTLLLIYLYIIGFIITIKYFKKMELYNLSLLIPFSSFEIDFRDSFEWKFDSSRVKSKISYLKLQTLTGDIIKLLDSLEDYENYSMSLSFISSYKEWQDNKDKVHPLWIDNAIIVNKESDPLLITQFIMDTLDSKGNFVTNWLFKDSSINSMDPVILTVTVRIKVKI
jgi:uncharacterized protein YneF (UPF0154 family)